MQTVAVYNATPNAIPVAGLGSVPSNTRVEGAISQIVFDQNFDAYLTKGPAAGMLFLDTAGLYLPLAENPARYYLQYAAVTAVGALAATVRFARVTNAGASYLITLPAANALPKDAVIYFYYDSLANDVTIGRAGSDTINGATAALPLDSTAPNKVKRFRTDGVSAWVTF